MQIKSTNIAIPKTIIWDGKQITTGIYKTPINKPIYLGKRHVIGDEVSDKKVHGGEFKACYIFSENQYSFWKNLYPNLDWHFGMFGENLTVTGLDETDILIGSIYKLGNALVQITQPREPCFKFGVKFGSQDVLNQFIEHGYPGTYLRILKEGFVSNGDAIELVEQPKNSLSTFQFFKLLFSKEKNQEHLLSAINNNALPLSKREKLKAFIV